MKKITAILLLVCIIFSAPIKSFAETSYSTDPAFGAQAAVLPSYGVSRIRETQPGEWRFSLGYQVTSGLPGRMVFGNEARIYPPERSANYPIKTEVFASDGALLWANEEPLIQLQAWPKLGTEFINSHTKSVSIIISVVAGDNVLIDWGPGVGWHSYLDTDLVRLKLTIDADAPTTGLASFPECSISVNDGVWVDIGNQAARNSNGYQWITPTGDAFTESFTYYDPIIIKNNNIKAILGDTIDWICEIEATWGNSTTKTIPSQGKIEDLSLNSIPTDPKLSVDGNTYDQVGHRKHQYLVRDSDSLGTEYPGDTTFAETERFITVVTEEELGFEIYRNDDSTIYNGDWLAPNSTTADSGRQTSVNLVATTDTPGEYKFTIKKGDSTIKSELKVNSPSLPLDTVTVKEEDYDTDSPTNAGESFTSILMSNNEPPITPVPLSRETSPAKVVKIDSQAPNAPTVSTTNAYKNIDINAGLAPSAIDNGASGVPDVADDGYYYKFVPAGTTGVIAPSGNDTGWESAATYSLPLVDDSYDLYVYAKDRATNRSGATKANTSGPIIVNNVGGVTVVKTTTKGATIHADDCTNFASIDKEVSCGSACTDGAGKDLVQGSSLVYKLNFTNTFTTRSTTGTFTDYLPAGIDTSTPPTITTNDPTVFGGSLDATLEGGRWKVTGDYTLAASGSAEVTITCKAPLYEDITDASKVISNQATLTWEASGEGSLEGTTESNYANHRINEPAKISKTSSEGAALHALDCPNSTSIEKKGDCKSTCVAGNPGTITVGETITYELSFENPSEVTQYFATDAAKFYDKMPSGVTLADQAWSVELSGDDTYTERGTTPPTGKAQLGGTWPMTNGSNLSGLSFEATGVSQDGNKTLSLAPGAKLVITVEAEVIEDGSDNLVNQIKSGYKVYGDNNDALTTADGEVMEVNSNYATYQRKAAGVDTKFTKVGADDLDTPLAGAKFALYKWTGTPTEYATHEGDILDTEALNGGIASGKWMRATTDGADGTITDDFTTLADGEVDLGMLPDGIYTLIETQAPQGYELPVGQWILTIDGSKPDTSAGNYKIEYSAKGTILPPATAIEPGDNPGDAPTYKIVNVRPFSIGMSGANGTIGITIIGLLLMLLAGIGYSIYNVRRKTSGKEKLFMKR